MKNSSKDLSDKNPDGREQTLMPFGIDSLGNQLTLSKESATSTYPTTSALPREGSTLYYALLHSDPATRANTCQILAMLQNLAQALVEVSEPLVAEKKIHWWHEEVDRLIDRQPRHPSTKAALAGLQSSIESDPANVKKLLIAILAANNNEKYRNAADTMDFEQRLVDDYGARLELVSIGLSGVSTQALKADASAGSGALTSPVIRNLCIGLGLQNRLQHCHSLHYQGYPVWPDAWYAKHDLEPQQLAEKTSLDRSQALFDTIYLRAIEALDGVLQNPSLFPDMDPAAARPIYIQASLRRHQLLLWQRKKFNPMQSYMTLTPFRKAWLGWRAKRRFKVTTDQNPGLDEHD